MSDLSSTPSSGMVMIISSDCHAGAQPETYRRYLPEKLRARYTAVAAADAPEGVILVPAVESRGQAGGRIHHHLAERLCLEIVRWGQSHPVQNI